MQYAQLWRRNVAIIADLPILIIAFFIISFLTGQNYFLSNFVYQIVCALYFICLTASEQKGTFGQKLLKIQVVDLYGYKLSPLQSVTRYLAWGLPIWPIIAASSLPRYGTIMDRVTDAEWAENYPDAYQAYIITPEVELFITINIVLLVIMIIGALIWILPILKTKEKTGIHDLVCKQRVIIRKDD